MIVEHSLLYTENPADPFAHYRYSNAAEIALATLIGITDVDQPSGYHPEYDFKDLHTGKTFEVKCQFHKLLHVEYRQSKADMSGVRRPSGIELSTADYWIFVSNEFSNATGSAIGKVRAFKRSVLLTMYQHFKDAGGSTANHFVINPWEGMGKQHIWLGDIDATTAPNSFYLTTWARKGHNLYSGFTRPPRPPSRDPFPNRTDTI
jgi:hypothetical protein